MDVDAYATAHGAEWQRLHALVSRRSRLTGAEADELVVLYQRTATHLSVVRSAAPDPVLVGWLSSTVAKARSALTGSAAPGWRVAGHYLTRGFPAAVYRARRWWITVAVLFLLVTTAIATWVAQSPDVQASVATPAEVRSLVEEDFAAYYSSNPAGSFATQVWLNNTWVAAICLISGVVLVPVVYVLWQNALNVGVTAGLMADNGRLDLFFGLITPHGLLELTAVFVAAGAGLKLGWTVVDPGPLPRSTAVAAQGRATAGMVIGLGIVLLVSGVIEGFVTPSGLPTWARITIGALALAAFLGYVFVLGRRAANDGDQGDVDPLAAGDLAPTAG